MATASAIFEHTDIVQRVRELSKQIGNTPLRKISNMGIGTNVQVYAKLEWQQLSGSVKARAAYQIFRAAIESGELFPGKSLLDATSGNTGIAYATIGRELGIDVTLCLPENASSERKEILSSLGAEIIYTSKFEGTDGSQQAARQLAVQNPDKYFYADQYKNDNNWKSHYYHTAIEIYQELPGLTHFVAGLGTTGTFVGTGRRLRELNPSIQLISVQPDNPLHGLEGWKHLETAVVPGIYDSTVAHKNIETTTEEAYEYMRLARDREGLFLSPSSAANLASACRIAATLSDGIIVTVLPDNADKYGEVVSKLF